MLSNRLGRFLTLILSLVAVVIVLAIIQNFIDMNELEGLLFTIFLTLAVAVIHQINNDLLDFKFMENVVFRTIKQVLFYAAALGATFFAFTLFYAQGYSGEEFIGQLFYCMLLPAGFSITALCIIANGEGYENEHIPFFTYYSLVPSVIIGLIIAALGPSFYIFAGILVAIIGIAAIVLLTRNYGFIYGDGSSYVPKKPKVKKPENKSKMPPELFNKLYDEMGRICNRYNGSKYLGYGIKVTVTGSGILKDDEAIIVVNMDVYLSNTTATSEYQVKSAANEALSYQKQQMQYMYNELEKAVQRLLPQYNYYVDFSYTVKPGSSNTY